MTTHSLYTCEALSSPVSKQFPVLSPGEDSATPFINAGEGQLNSFAEAPEEDTTRRENRVGWNISDSLASSRGRDYSHPTS